MTIKNNKNNRSLKLTPSHYKILKTVSLLNEQDLYPLAKGVGNILKGEIDLETKQYVNLITYGTLISFSSKKICRYILMLTRYGYLAKKYDIATNDLYICITPNGVSNLSTYEKKHKNLYKKKEKIHKKYIVSIK